MEYSSCSLQFCQKPESSYILLNAAKFEDNSMLSEATVKSMGSVDNSRGVPSFSVLNGKSFAIMINTVKALNFLSTQALD